MSTPPCVLQVTLYSVSSTFSSAADDAADEFEPFDAAELFDCEDDEEPLDELFDDEEPLTNYLMTKNCLTTNYFLLMKYSPMKNRLMTKSLRLPMMNRRRERSFLPVRL